MKAYSLLILVIELFLIATPIYTNENLQNSKMKFRELQNKIDVLVNNSEIDFNGCILVACGEEVVYEKNRGSYGQPTLQDQFLIGSCSKQFTAVLILQLVDQKLIDLKKPIKAYLPELLDEWAGIVTIEQLLNHTSGIKGFGEHLEFEPGTEFKYSPTFSYFLCCQIAERVTGCDFETLLNKLFLSANMKNTGAVIHKDFLVAKNEYPLLIQGFREGDDETIHEVLNFGVDNKVYDYKWIAGGGIISTLHDLIKWNLNLHKGNLISPISYIKMITPSITRNHPRYGTIGYGFGIQVFGENGLELSHSGYIDGYMSTLIYYPESEMSVIVLENISRSTKDVIRAFNIHDKLRNLVRFEILKS